MLLGGDFRYNPRWSPNSVCVDTEIAPVVLEFVVDMHLQLFEDAYMGPPESMPKALWVRCISFLTGQHPQMLVYFVCNVRFSFRLTTTHPGQYLNTVPIQNGRLLTYVGSMCGVIVKGDSRTSVAPGHSAGVQKGPPPRRALALPFPAPSGVPCVPPALCEPPAR